MVCLRCDCKRPGGVSPVTSVGYGTVKSTNKVDIDSRLAANEEKAHGGSVRFLSWIVLLI
jgi:hypothetical protein